jgi:hypothetical protein
MGTKKNEDKKHNCVNNDAARPRFRQSGTQKENEGAVPLLEEMYRETVEREKRRKIHRQTHIQKREKQSQKNKRMVTYMRWCFATARRKDSRKQVRE